MEHPHAYRTKQGEQIAACLFAQEGPVTATELHAHLLSQGMRIGLATIYRQLDKLVSAGKAKKLTPDDGGVRYQRVPEGESEQFFLKCEGCGMLTPLHCEQLDDLRRHISADHGFSCNPDKSILYGTCKGCTAQKP